MARRTDVRLRTLLSFYDSFLKLTLRGMREIMGERGAESVLRFAARDYGLSVAKSMKALGRSSLKEALAMMLERAGTEPEIEEGDGKLLVKLRKCPFRRPEEEPLLCLITEGLLEGFSSAFRKARVTCIGTRARGADCCSFEIHLL